MSDEESAQGGADEDGTPSATDDATGATAWYVFFALAAFVFGTPLVESQPGPTLTLLLMFAMFALPVALAAAIWDTLTRRAKRRR